MRTIVTLTATLGALATLIILLTGGLPTKPAHRTPTTIPETHTPWDYTIDTWDQALGGDQELTQANYDTLNNHTDPALKPDHDTITNLAETTLKADLTSTNQTPINDLLPPSAAPYWPQPINNPPAQCTNITILATSPTHLPIPENTSPQYTQYAKTLIAYSATCQGVTYTKNNPGIAHIYTAKYQDSWIPLRSWQIPADTKFNTLPGATEPYEWELKPAQQCTTPHLIRARIPVIEAFTAMCEQAQQDNIPLTAVSGYRTRAEQAALFNQAVETYGSEKAARKHVAYADDTLCTSRHCSGLALNIEENPETTKWLNKPIACRDPDGTLTENLPCTDEQTPIPNMTQWGFATPLPTSPGYLEFTLPIGTDKNSSLSTPNCAPHGLPTANQIAAIFRCRLARENITGPDQDKVVAEALTVARCASGWNPNAAAFGGRHTSTPHPTLGHTYTNQGVFMLTEAHARAGWLPEGETSLKDPIANINAAASLWLTTKSWDQFDCATGNDTTFQPGPVLPQYGGPDLPKWAHQY